MNKSEKIQNLRKAFQTILRTDYISISDINQLTTLESYYVDYFNNVPKVLQDQDSFISGRRGTGKTALLMRCYYECLKTVSTKTPGKSMIFENKKVLPNDFVEKYGGIVAAMKQLEDFTTSLINKRLCSFPRTLLHQFDTFCQVQPTASPISVADIASASFRLPISPNSFTSTSV